MKSWKDQLRDLKNALRGGHVHESRCAANRADQQQQWEQK